MFARWVFSFVLVLCPALALAQPLADKVPADALVYIGWQGVESMPAGYQQSHLKAVLDESNIPALVNDFLPRLVERANQANRRAGQQLGLLAAILRPMWKHPTAVYLSAPDWQGAGRGPVPKGAILCEAGGDSDALLEQFNVIAQQMQRAPFPVKAFKQDNLVGLEFGFTEPAQAVAGAGGAPAISGGAGFKAALAQVNKQPVGILYIDAEGVIGQIDQFVNMLPVPEPKQQWPVIRDALGVGGLKRIVATCGFDGRDWDSQLLIAAPAPRTGLLSLLDAPPLSDDALRTVPRTAVMASAVRFDLAKLVAQVRAMIVKINPDAQQGIDMFLGIVQNQIGLDLQKDILEPLGDEWVVYMDPNSTGGGLLGIVAVNKLRKPAEAEQSLNKLMSVLNEAIKQNAPAKVTIRFDEVKRDGGLIHFVSLPVVAPSWAVKSGNLYVGLYPQVVDAALNNGGSGRSILDNPDFVALRKRLGGERASAVSFLDLPKTTGGGYQLVLALSQLGLGFADMFGVKTPPMVLPPLAQLREHLTPAGGVAWSDDAGLHMRHITPFPGAELIASPAGGVEMLAPAAAIPMLAWERTRAKEARVRQAMPAVPPPQPVAPGQ